MQGAPLPYPYGGKQRQIMVDLDPAALQAKGLSPLDVVERDRRAEPDPARRAPRRSGRSSTPCEMNGSPPTRRRAQRPADEDRRTARRSTSRDVANVRDGFSPQTNIVHVDGQRGVLMTVFKIGNASTLDIVSRVKATMPSTRGRRCRRRSRSRSLFDQSLFVRAAIQGVLREGAHRRVPHRADDPALPRATGAARSSSSSRSRSRSWSRSSRSRALGETINVMTLGGLALAVGILVDDATVAIENIDRNLAMGKDVRTAILDGAQQIAVPAFVSTLCICIVFVPMFFLTGVARYLFVPLAEAVVFAMLASYVLSRTLVPTMALLPAAGATNAPRRGPHASTRAVRIATRRAFERGFERAARRATGAGWPRALAHPRAVRRPRSSRSASASLVPRAGRSAATSSRPSTPARSSCTCARAPGTRIEETARAGRPGRRHDPRDDPAARARRRCSTTSACRTAASTCRYSDGGTDRHRRTPRSSSRSTTDHAPTADLRVASCAPTLPSAFPGAHVLLPAGRHRHAGPELRHCRRRSTSQVIGARTSAATIAVAGQLADRDRGASPAPSTCTCSRRSTSRRCSSTSTGPRRAVGRPDRARRRAATCSSRSRRAARRRPTFWLDPKNGVSYIVAVQTPQYRDRLAAGARQHRRSRRPPATRHAAAARQPRDDLADRPARRHLALQRAADVRRLRGGRRARPRHRSPATSAPIVDAVRARRCRAAATSSLRGQVETMTVVVRGPGLRASSFAIVLVYLLMVVNFQSWLDPFIIIMALPGALAGIVVDAVPHAHDAQRAVAHGRDHVHRRGDGEQHPGRHVRARAAARGRDGARRRRSTPASTRLRPVLMTALAMIIGMLPMALGLGEGGEQNAPLGRAVIGGLVFATVATLFFVPCVFSLASRPERRAHDRAPQTSTPARRGAPAGCFTTFAAAALILAAAGAFTLIRRQAELRALAARDRRAADGGGHGRAPDAGAGDRRPDAAGHARGLRRVAHLRADDRLPEEVVSRHRQPRVARRAARRHRHAGDRPGAVAGSGGARPDRPPTPRSPGARPNAG